MKNITLNLTVIFLLLFATSLMFSSSIRSGGKVKEGSIAPEIYGLSLNGNTMKLSDFKGQIVLIDFWASWCVPCRNSNPGLVRLNRIFKGKKFKNATSFQIISISMDKDLSAWKDAIEQDNLTWPNHICDQMGGEGQAAQAYNVKAIPTSYLIDENGIVVGKNLTPELITEYLNNSVIE